MTVTEPTETRQQLSLGTVAARNLATTTKSAPHMQGISSRWLLRVLPWEQVSGGVYRVNRRLSHVVGDGRVTFVRTGSQFRVIPRELGELPLLRGLDDEVLSALADRFVQQDFGRGDVIVEAGDAADRVFLIAHGKVNKLGVGKYGEVAVLGTLADGNCFGQHVLADPRRRWDWTVKALSPCAVLTLDRDAIQELSDRFGSLPRHIERVMASRQLPRNKQGEAAIELASGHAGEPELPGTFVDYETSPREYGLSVAQTVLRVHTRVADLYNQPMDQVEHQLRLTIEALRERQEHELVNNAEFGLVHNTDPRQRIHTRSGPPTPADLDELLSRRRKSRFLLAHPRTIAAFGRECNSRGIYPPSVELHGRPVQSWRGVPLLPCDKIPVMAGNTSSVLAIRTGVADDGIIGLHQTGIPDEYEPGLNVRFMGINDRGIISYLVSAYYSVAVLVPDALGVLENVEISR